MKLAVALENMNYFISIYENVDIIKNLKMCCLIS